MAGIYRFHNRFHRTTHHTLTAGDYNDSGADPIASIDEPFIGIFYNTLTDNTKTFSIPTNSYQWWSAFTLVNLLSTNWDHTKSVYSTVSSLSTNWNLGYSGYVTFLANSGKYESTYSTVCANSANWGSPYLMYTNRVQEYTHSKTFSGQNLFITFAPSGVGWDLDTQQVAFIDCEVIRNENNLLSSIKILNPNTRRRGGLFTLYVKQNNHGNFTVNFDSCYRFNKLTTRNDLVSASPNLVTVFNFLTDGTLMYGDFYNFPNMPD